MQELEEKREKAITVGININNTKYFRESMEELKSLVDACNIDVIGSLEQNLEQINRTLYIGTGKVDELKDLINELSADLIVFNNELTHSQLRNLQRILDVPILDRTSLILQIFATRAKSKEAKLQVEVAKLQYMLPRLVGLHDSLGRQGAGSGLSNKGSGEKKLELDRRRIESRLSELNKELEALSSERVIQRRKRENSKIPLVSLVGYTNAGKSTVLNTLVDTYTKDESKKVLQKDMLFATLDTSVRNITLENKKTFLLSDTVGFISELPHMLVKAFRSTLEEVKNADLLLHVIDYSDENHVRHEEVTEQTLQEIGAGDIPVIKVYNKSDLVDIKIPKIKDDSIYMSAEKNIGMQDLIKLISKQVFCDYIDTEMLIPFDKGNVLSYLNDNATINSTEYIEQGTQIKLSLRQDDYNKYIEYVTK